MRLPSNSPVTPGYGFGSTLPPYSSSNTHNGVDFQHTPDNTIYAPFGGKITQAYNDRDGNGTYMTEPNGRFHGLLHASKYLVPNGAQVKEGQPIAVMGETGFAQGVHLHWCVKENGKFINPMSLIKEENMPGNADNYTVEALAVAILGRTAQGDKNLQNNIGRPVNDVIDTFRSYPEAKARAERADHPTSVGKDSVLDYVNKNLK